MPHTQSRPLLGLSCCRRTDAYPEPVHWVIERYAAAAARYTRADVVLLPALADLADARSMAGRLDGLLLTGSTSNIEPARYGATLGEGPFDPARDASNLGMAEAMLAAGKPVFGICRGLQELNVLLGGTLRAMPRAPVDHHAPDGADTEAMFAHTHAILPEPGGQLAAAFGPGKITVNSVHYQGIDRLADGLTIEARGSDGVIEAVAGTIGRAPLYAVQWQPEWQTEAHAAYRWFFARLDSALHALRTS